MQSPGRFRSPPFAATSLSANHPRSCYKRWKTFPALVRLFDVERPPTLQSASRESLRRFARIKITIRGYMLTVESLDDLGCRRPLHLENFLLPLACMAPANSPIFDVGCGPVHSRFLTIALRTIEMHMRSVSEKSYIE